MQAQSNGADPAGGTTPGNDGAPTAVMDRGPTGGVGMNGGTFDLARALLACDRQRPCDGMARQALLAIEGEAYGQAFLDRVNAGTAQPGELASLMVFLTGGPMLDGACCAIEKVLRRAQHG